MVGFLRSLHDTLRIWNIPVPPLEHWDMRTLLNAVGQFHPPFHCNILYSPLVLCGKQNLKNKCSRPTFNKYFWSPSIAPLYQVYGEKFLNAKLRYPRYSWQVFSHHYINIPSSLGNLRTHISIGAPGIKSDQRAPWHDRGFFSPTNPESRHWEDLQESLLCLHTLDCWKQQSRLTGNLSTGCFPLLNLHKCIKLSEKNYIQDPGFKEAFFSNFSK